MTDWMLETAVDPTKVPKKKEGKAKFKIIDFMKGREKVEAYRTFFDVFQPCATKKTNWERQISRGDPNDERSEDMILCTVSDEAFALLLLENSYDRWCDLYFNNKGALLQRRGKKGRDVESDVAPKYTRGGIKYSTNDATGMEKGWSQEGKRRFNELYDSVKQDRKQNPSFEKHWLDARREAQTGKTAPVKEKRLAVMTRSELFESDEEQESMESNRKRLKKNSAESSDSEPEEEQN